MLLGDNSWIGHRNGPDNGVDVTTNRTYTRSVRTDYGEDRWTGVGMIQGRVVVVVYTEREAGDTLRVISLRKALRHEREQYEKALSH